MRGNGNGRAAALASLLAIMICAGSFQPLFADGDITFTDIAAGGGAGLAYERFPTPMREALRSTFYATLPSPIPGGYTRLTPMKPYGSPGLGLLDYDNDGDLDIYVTNGPGHANSLFQNQQVPSGSATFVDVGMAAGVGAAAQDSSGVCFGDIDNDGDEDLYVTGIGEPNVLFRNNGNGTFSDITAAAGAGAGNLHHSSCAFGDFDGDGLLDLVVGNTYDDWTHRFPIQDRPNYPGLEANQLFLRDGSAPGIQFADATAGSGLLNLPNLPDGKSLTWTVAAVDYDQDGDTDVLQVDYQGVPPQDATQNRGYIQVFRNDGTAHFSNETDLSVIASSWQGISFGDYNCDGNIDYFGTNVGYWVGGPPYWSRVFLGNGTGGFHDAGVGSLLATTFGWGTATADYDNDGDQDIVYYGDEDLFTVFSATNPGSIYFNQGCSADFSAPLGVLSQDHRFRQVNGVASGDLNLDGFEDIVTVANFQFISEPGRLILFPLAGLPLLGSVLDPIASAEVIERRSTPPGFLIYVPHTILHGNLAVEVNSGNANGWAAVRLLGSKGLASGGQSNRDGIGAAVRFQPEGGKAVIVPIVGGASHASQSSRIASFGLGTAAKGTVDVRWPGGTHNRLYEVASGERIRFPEIPCSLDASWKNFGLYNSCVVKALDQLRNAGLITQAERQRFVDSAVRAFQER